MLAANKRHFFTIMKHIHNWQQKTLETLENNNWGDPDTAPTGLVKRCLLLRRKPVGAFTVEDLRCMIGQQIGLSYLLPLAIEQLTINIFAEGDLYEGDLLEQVLRIDTSFWNSNETYWHKIHTLLQQHQQEITRQKFDSTKFYSCKFSIQ